MHDRIVILGDASSNHIIRWARGAVSHGYHVNVISCGGNEIEGIRTTIFGENPGGLRNFLRYFGQVKKEIKKCTPDLIHSFQATGYGLWGTVRIGCPKILTPLGSDIMQTEQRGFLYQKYVQYVLKRHDCFTTPSRFLMDKLNSLYSVTKEKTSAIPFGVELPDAAKVHEERKPVKIVYMKHLLPVYGPQILLEAAVIARKQGVPVKLDMYGHEHESGWVREMADRLDVASMLELKGWIDMDKVMTRLLEYDIMVMPSLLESFGVAALEASAVGLPVVATTVGGIPEIVRHNETGILVPPNDAKSLAGAIIKLASDVELRKKMGEAGRKFAAARYRWHDNLNEMMELYRKLIESKVEK